MAFIWQVANFAPEESGVPTSKMKIWIQMWVQKRGMMINIGWLPIMPRGIR
jgi:hypothetical protein